MPKAFDPDQYGLVPCHLKVSEGHIFVNLSRGEKPPVIDTEMDWFVDVLAYVFSRNSFPAGRDELAADFAALRLIRFAPEPIGSDASADPAAPR